jgi:serine/threonine-protein kinase HipA
MPRRPAHIPLNVFLNGRLVGRLRRQASGAVDFRYDESWLSWEHTMPVSLSMPLREERYTGEVVVAVFDNLLPDNDDIRRHLAERVGADGHDMYSLLARVGRDCAGALQFLPEGQEPERPGEVSGRPVDDERIAAILNNLGRAPLGADEEGEFRISLAGAQEKTALLNWDGQWQIPHGVTATTHILKPQIGMLRNGIDLTQSVENELLCLQLTAALGLPAARSEIRDFAGVRALVVERFDRLRTGGGRLLRLPHEDCCQALSVPPVRKYESDGGPGLREILDLLKASDEPERDRRTVLKAQIVFWLLGATDGHAKNFSIRLLPGGRFALAPLYDVLSAQPNVDAGQIRRNAMKLAMAVGRRRRYRIDEIMPRHFVQTADLCALPKGMAEGILAELATEAPDALARVEAELPSGFPEAIATPILQGIRARLRTFEAALA